eukprot:528898-Alexandrium_andersonii.AAC.1
MSSAVRPPWAGPLLWGGGTGEADGSAAPGCLGPRAACSGVPGMREAGVSIGPNISTSPSSARSASAGSSSSMSTH